MDHEIAPTRQIAPAALDEATMAVPILRHVVGSLRRNEMRSAIFYSALLGLSVVAACQRSATFPASEAAREVRNLHAFARLYGAVRWFHPSDAAAAVDWDRFAIDGARRVRDAGDAVALRARLEELFTPIAPTMKIMADGDSRRDVVAARPPDGAQTFWQHLGYGDSTAATGYVSKRSLRDQHVAVEGDAAVALFQQVDATPLRDKQIRLRAKVRTVRHAYGQIWLRVEHDAETRFIDTMARRPVMSSEWTNAEIVTRVAADATRIVFGPLVQKSGIAWYDDFELASQDASGVWHPVDIANPGSEELDALTGWRAGVGRGAQEPKIVGWNVLRDTRAPAAGSASLRIEQETKVVTGDLFTDRPQAGEVATVELGDGLHATVPIILDAEQTARRDQHASAMSSSGYDPLAGVGDVIVVWNVLEHFWPYWDVTPTDWPAQLDRSLTEALADRSMDQHVKTLERLSAAAPDGHAAVTCPGTSELAYPSFTLELVENQVVVTASGDERVTRGDVVLEIDGSAARQRVEEEAVLISGSRQWRIDSALRRLGVGPADAAVALRVQRGDQTLGIASTRQPRRYSPPAATPAIAKMPDGTYYVDLARASIAELDAALANLVTAPGIVFDIRGRPSYNHQFLSHLMTTPSPPASWVTLAHIVRPDSGSSPASWEVVTDEPSLTVATPHIAGRAAFLIGPRAISYAESVIELVAHNHLGALVGSTTAGTNGDIAEIGEPSGCSTIFTGRRATKMDGSRLHLVGISPTIPSERTLAGVVAGRDEVLERALAYVRTGR